MGYIKINKVWYMEERLTDAERIKLGLKSLKKDKVEVEKPIEKTIKEDKKKY